MALTVDFLEIPADTSISEPLACRSGRIVRIGMPDDWTAAPLTFRVSPNGVNYFDLFHTQVTTGAFTPYEAVVPTVIPHSMLSLPPDTGMSIGWIRFRSGTRLVPVNQAAARKFTILFESNV